MRLSMLALVITLLSAPRLDAQDLPPGSYRFEEARIPLSDAVHLSAQVFLPEADGAYPVVLYVQPYNPQSSHRQRRGVYWAEHGYATVMVRPRGRYDSEGTYLPFIDEVPDLLETLAWVLDQPWSDGRGPAARHRVASGTADDPSFRAPFFVSGD